MRLLLTLSLSLLFACGQATTPVPTAISETENQSSLALTKELLKMSAGNLGDNVLIAKIKRYGKPIHLTSNQLITLKKQGLSDRVLKELVQAFRD
jgi:hypothetical protein